MLLLLELVWNSSWFEIEAEDNDKFTERQLFQSISKILMKKTINYSFWCSISATEFTHQIKKNSVLRMWFIKLADQKLWKTAWYIVWVIYVWETLKTQRKRHVPCGQNINYYYYYYILCYQLLQDMPFKVCTKYAVFYIWYKLYF